MSQVNLKFYEIFSCVPLNVIDSADDHAKVIELKNMISSVQEKKPQLKVKQEQKTFAEISKSMSKMAFLFNLFHQRLTRNPRRSVEREKFSQCGKQHIRICQGSKFC